MLYNCWLLQKHAFHMIDNITKYPRSKDQDYTFSIVVPTWNNLDYLKNCIESIDQNIHKDFVE